MPGDAGIQGVIDGGQTAQDYLAKSTFINGDGKQKILSGYVTGDTGFTIPGAPGSVSLVAGFETKSFQLTLDLILLLLWATDLVQVERHLPIGGKYDVDEFFLELGIPVWIILSVEAGFRSAEYSTGAETDSTKLGAYWTLMIMFHSELHFKLLSVTLTSQNYILAVSDGLVDLDNDPCSIQQNGDPATATQAQCALTGLAANLYNTDLNSPADQYNTKGGGNPNVAPEESESLTIGAVITPESIPGLTVNC